MDEKELKCIMASIIYAGYLADPHKPEFPKDAEKDAAETANKIFDAVWNIPKE